MHCPWTHVVLPGHSQFALQPGTHVPWTQIFPAPSEPGLQSPSFEHEAPVLPESCVPASVGGGGEPRPMGGFRGPVSA